MADSDYFYDYTEQMARKIRKCTILEPIEINYDNKLSTDQISDHQEEKE